MSEIVSSNFDYGILKLEDQNLVREAADEIRGARDRHIDEALRMGRALIRVKEALPHGEFGKWLSAEFGWAERTAQNLMRAVETFGQNPQRVADLPLRLVYALSAPSTPEAARNRVVEKLDRGERPTEHEIVSLIKDEKEGRKREKIQARREAARAQMTAEALERERRAQNRRAGRLAAEKRRRKAEEDKRRDAALKAAELVHNRLGMTPSRPFSGCSRKRTVGAS